MSDKPRHVPADSPPQPPDNADYSTASPGPLRPPLKEKAPKASSHRTPAKGKEPERIAGIVPGVFSPALHRMMYRGLLGSPFASDFDLGFMLADPVVAKRAVKFITSLHKPNGKPGRPRKEDVTEGLRLRSEGKPHKEIYAILNKQTKTERLALRDAMRKRTHRAKKRDKSRSENVQADKRS